MRISVIGTGYVGLVAGACFADNGNDVTCVDHDAAKIDALNRDQIPIYEPGLDQLVKRNRAEGRLNFTTSVAEGIQNAEVIFLAVGTPALPNGEPNTEFLKAAAEQVGRALRAEAIIVNKSTVPIGAHRWVEEWIGQYAQCDFMVVSNPEFLKEGTAVEDFLKPDRVVIGTDSEEAYIKMADLYRPFVRQGNSVIWMDPISAEISKYACNAFLAARISFMNELASLCDKVGGDIEEVRRVMSTDERIGRHFLYAGVGYGGSCFPKDVQALMTTAVREKVSLGIVKATHEANARQKGYLLQHIEKYFKGNLKGRTFALWGISFKPNTDDIREAPALVMIDRLLELGVRVQAYDPVAIPNCKAIYGSRIDYAKSSYTALEGADALIVLTEWNEFRYPDFDKVKKVLKSPVIFDGRNVFEPNKMSQLGFHYCGVGRGQVYSTNVE